MADIMIIVDIAITVFGFYLIFSAIKLKNKNEISGSIFLSKDVQMKKCRDIEGYKNFMVTKTLIAGALIALFGGLTVLDDFTGCLETVGLFTFLPILGGLIWFGIFSKKGQDNYYL